MNRNFKTVINEIMQKYKELIEYEKKGIFPSVQFISYFYSLVHHGVERWYGSSILYDLHSSLVERCVNESFNSIKNAQESDYLNLYNNQINKINYIIFHLNRGFLYLDRSYNPILSQPISEPLSVSIKDREPIILQSLKIFKNKFLVPCKDNLFKALINYLLHNNNLENEEISRKIKKIFNLMKIEVISKPKISKRNNEIIWENEGSNLSENENKIFDDWFNNYFLKDISSYYKNKSTEFVNLAISELISSILNVKDHLNSLKNYFDEIYYNKISLIFDENFIKNNKEKIENYFFNLDKNGFKQFYEKNKNSKSCLNFIFTFLIYSIQSNDLKIFENKGIQFNLKEENICIPIEIKKGLDKFFSEFFNKSDPEYNNSLIRICQRVLNMKSYSKKLALYVNDCMRKNFKGKSEEEKNNELNQIIQVFSLLIDKSSFIFNIEKQMSERLIKNSSISLNTEKKFITLIKQEVGIYYTNKMSKMISDLDRSNKEIEEYNKLKNKSLPNDIKFEPLVISQGIWFIKEQYYEKMSIPTFLSAFTDDFENIYKQRYHNHTKLFWLHGLSKIEIKYLCFKDNYFSKSTLLQFLILLQIEKNNRLSILKIAENIGCKANLVLDDIYGLIFNPTYNPQHLKDKGLLLGNFDEKNKTFKETDEFWFNFDFKSNKLRFNTKSILKKSEQEIKKEEKDEIEYIRKYNNNIIQAAIARIMKSQNGKKVQHVWLINEVSKQISLFTAQPQQIKDNIEKIIEKNIIMRDEENPSYYKYIA